MLKYVETNWLSEEGLETHDYQISFEKVKSQSTIKEQEKRPERLSLVKFFDYKQTRQFVEICSLFQKDVTQFYFNKNRKFHSTLLGFPVVESEYYDMVKEKINQFSEKTPMEMKITFDVIRLGTKYENNNALKPIKGISNGTIISYGDTICNEPFVTFGNNLASFLSNDKDLNPILGQRFRRKFPTVWCTMGHYTKDFKISPKLEAIFHDYMNFESSYFESSCRELELGKSCYKDLRDWKPLKKFRIGF